MRKLISSTRFWLGSLLLAGASFMPSTVHAYISSNPNGSGTDYYGRVLISGHTHFDWFLSPNWAGIPGNTFLWVNGAPIAGTYTDYGPYRVVSLEQYDATFVYYVDIDPVTQNPSAVVVYFTDQFGNWISPDANVLREAL